MLKNIVVIILQILLCFIGLYIITAIYFFTIGSKDQTNLAESHIWFRLFFSMIVALVLSLISIGMLKIIKSENRYVKYFPLVFYIILIVIYSIIK